jgi:Spy/CpxP family protein refolding chaperone
MFDPARRSEMMVQRLAEDVGLNKDQRGQIKDILDKAQTAAKPLQQELQDTRRQIKEAVKAGKSSDDVNALHQKLGASYAKLAAVQSNAFADTLKILKGDQKEDADSIYDTIGMMTGVGGRGMGPGGRGGFGPPGGFGPRGGEFGGPDGPGRPPGAPDRPDAQASGTQK